MPRVGKIANGCGDVEVEGQLIARKTDVVDHAALIGEGCATVIAGSAAKPVARMGDRYKCPMYEDSAHVGGFILTGAATVFAGGAAVARQHDPTLCVGEEAAGTQFEGLDDAGASGPADAKAAECRALWAKYDQEARDIIAPGDHDGRERNHIINGAYSSLYLKNRDLKWAGLAGYASKQVGCAMDHAKRIANDPYKPWAHDIANYTSEKLGEGNRTLFLDIYPMHRFFDEQGWDKFKECAGERRPPVPAAALDGFGALDKYNKTKNEKYLKEHVRAIAYHEQVNILQRDIYNDTAMREILDLNEGNIANIPSNALEARISGWLDAPTKTIPIGFNPRGPLQPVTEFLGAKAADVVMSDQCSDPTGKKTIPFKEGRSGNLYDIDQRLDWIMNDIGGYYFGNEGSPDHLRDLGNLVKTGAAHGGKYP